MNDVERELRDRFVRTEGRLRGPEFSPLTVPDELVHRTRRRQLATTAIGILAVAAVIAASVAGAAALVRSSERRVPTEPPDPVSAGTLVPVAAQPASFEGIVADTDGNLWSTTPGLTRLDPVTGSLRTFTVADDPAFAGVAKVLPAAEGGVWMLSPWYGPQQTIRRFDGERFAETTSPAAYVSDFAVAPDGTIWAGGIDVSRWNGVDWAVAPTEGRPAAGGSDAVEAGSIAVDAAGGVWVENIRYPGPDRLGISRFDGNAWSSYPVEEVFPFGAFGPDGGAIWTIVPGPTGDVWVGGNGAVSHFENGAWTAYPSDVLGLRNVMSIAVADGVVWVGGEATGSPAIARFDGASWVSVSDGLEGDAGNEYTQLAATPDGLWATTNTGLFRLAGSRWERVTTGDRPSDVMPPIVAAGADELWMGDWNARGGVWHLEGDRWTHFDEADGLPGGDLHAIAVAEDGTAWVAAKHGLGSFDGTSWRRVEPGRHTAVTVARNGVVWTASGELGEGVEGGWTIAPVGGTPLPMLTLLETKVDALAVGPDGDVWAGSAGWWELGGGLARFDGESWEPMEPVADAGSRILVTDIEVTPDGDVWVALEVPAEAEGTFTGLLLARYHDGAWTTFGEADGVTLDGGFWGEPLDVATDGSLLVAAQEGLLAYRDGAWSVLQAGIFQRGTTSIVSVSPDGTTWIAAGSGLFRLGPS